MNYCQPKCALIGRSRLIDRSTFDDVCSSRSRVTILPTLRLDAASLSALSLMRIASLHHLSSKIGLLLSNAIVHINILIS